MPHVIGSILSSVVRVLPDSSTGRRSGMEFGAVFPTCVFFKTTVLDLRSNFFSAVTESSLYFGKSVGLTFSFFVFRFRDLKMKNFE